LKLSGADMLMHSLYDEGVELIFGYPGGAALHIYDAIFRQIKLIIYLLDMNKARPMLLMDMLELQ